MPIQQNTYERLARSTYVADALSCGGGGGGARRPPMKLLEMA